MRSSVDEKDRDAGVEAQGLSLSLVEEVAEVVEDEEEKWATSRLAPLCVICRSAVVLR